MSEKLSPEKPCATVALGPLCAPPLFEFEAGRVYQRGYQLTLTVEDGARSHLVTFGQALTKHRAGVQQGMGEQDLLVQPLRLVPGDFQRVRYNPDFGAAAPISLRMDRRLMIDPGAVAVQARLNEGQSPAHLECWLVVNRAAGDEVHREQLQLTRGGDWQTIPLPAHQWGSADYRVTIMPVVEGVIWSDGPTLQYRRRAVDPKGVRISPWAPWTLVRDNSRRELVITDLQSAHAKWGVGQVDDAIWSWERIDSDNSHLIGKGEYRANPVSLQAPTHGYYAVFAQGSGHLQVGESGLVRLLRDEAVDGQREVFLEATDLTNARIQILALNNQLSRLLSLRLVPVEADSAKEMADEMSRPSTPFHGTDDWSEYFHSPARLHADQFQVIMAGQAEVGIRRLGWSIGRSTLEYHSSLSNATRFPAVPLDEAGKRHANIDEYRARAHMINEFDPLASVLQGRRQSGVEIWAWLAMQRHYGTDAYGGIFASGFFAEHPQWQMACKDGAKHYGMSYFFPAVRRERLDILLEVARRGVDGLLVGCVRQIPMLLYHPEMVTTYRRQTGVDPLHIDGAKEKEYRDWIRWRADFFTEFLRELKEGLEPIRERSSNPLPVAVRIPSNGLLLNLAQGLDVEQWCREGLVDKIQIHPLEVSFGIGDHDVHPYLELGKKYGISIVGGIGSTAFLDADRFGGSSNFTAALRRALGLLRSGVDGIELYEAELLAWSSHRRMLVSLFANQKRLEEFLADSNMEACYPVDASNAAAGHDNHSWFHRGWTTHGRESNSL